MGGCFSSKDATADAKKAAEDAKKSAATLLNLQGGPMPKGGWKAQVTVDTKPMAMEA